MSRCRLAFPSRPRHPGHRPVLLARGLHARADHILPQALPSRDGRLGDGRELTGVRTIDDAADLIWNYHGAGFYRSLKPNQHGEEILTLANHVAAIQPRVIVEIGTRDGGTLCIWSRCSPRLEHLISIDLPGGMHGGGYSNAREKLYRLFVNRPNCRLDLLRLDSQQGSTREQLLKLLNQRPIDFLFIDGDHRYAGVKRDYELYGGLVRPGGLIAFHDIRLNRYDSTIEVARLWEEIKSSQPHTREIIQAPYSGRYGIGIVTVS